MGFLTDLRSISREANELQKDWDPAEQMRRANAQMRAMSNSMAQSAAILSADPTEVSTGQVQVTAVLGDAGLMNGSPLLSLSVLVLADGRPPVPAQATIAVPAHQVHRVQPGAVLAARISRSDPAAFVVDWAV
jgi:hypothetical protein